MDNGFIRTGLRSFNCGDFRVSFFVVYRREGEFCLKVGFALPFRIPKRLTQAPRMPIIPSKFGFYGLFFRWLGGLCVLCVFVFVGWVGYVWLLFWIPGQ